MPSSGFATAERRRPPHADSRDVGQDHVEPHIALCAAAGCDRQRGPGAGGASGWSRYLAIPESARTVLRTPGEPLTKSVRSAAETSVGHDLGSVRIHDDATAGKAALALGADAFTFGRHVVMAPGRFQPGSAAGDRLLTHELTHVIQQGNPAGDIGEPDRVSSPDEATEIAAGGGAAGGAEPTSRSAGPSVAPHIARQSIHNPLFPCHEVSGSVMPGSFDYFGSLVHLAIQQHYVRTIDPLAATEYLIPGSGTLGGSGRADIVDSSGGVYEIKPYGLQSQGLEEAGGYVLEAETACDPGVNWHLGTRYWPPPPMVIGTSIVSSWLAGPGVILYLRRSVPPLPVPETKKETKPADEKKKVEKKEPAPPVTVPVPARSSAQLIKEWANSVLSSGADANAAAHAFFRDHPELPVVVLGLGTAAIIALVADDLTIAGILDDVLVPVIAALMRVAWQLA